MNKTRVQLINEAIFHLHTVEEVSVREIQYQLKIRGIELTLLEILNIIASFNYRTVKEKIPNKATVAKDKFRIVIDPLVRLIRREGITNKSLWLYFEWRNIPGPNSNDMNKEKLDALILSLDFKYPKKNGKSVNLTLLEMIELVENKLSEEEHETLNEWINKDVE